MTERATLPEDVDGSGGLYFAPRKTVECIPTGCTTLDCALGGGWAEGRIANIVGDKSTGKTLLCIEAAANFVIKYPNGRVLYRECEDAFDPAYAEALGMPMKNVEYGDSDLQTVEDMFEDLQGVISKRLHKITGVKPTAKETLSQYIDRVIAQFGIAELRKRGRKLRPTLYITDSLDSLSDRAEMRREMDEGTFGAMKAKNLSQLFRRLRRQIPLVRVTWMVVSQVRANIGKFFVGRSVSRSGGMALDFYASQVLYLQHLGEVTKTIGGIKRSIGIDIRAKVDKNKVDKPHRIAKFPILFEYGVDDKKACKAFMQENKGKWPATREEVIAHYYDVERRFQPQRRKYA